MAASSCAYGTLADVTPAMLIEFPVESAPRLYMRAQNEGEERRLNDWLVSHPELTELIERALELAQEQRAA